MNDSGLPSSKSDIQPRKGVQQMVNFFIVMHSRAIVWFYF